MNPGVLLYPGADGPQWATLHGEDAKRGVLVWDNGFVSNLDSFLHIRGIDHEDVQVVPPEALPWALEHWGGRLAHGRDRGDR